jgi:hypothetical protein
MPIFGGIFHWFYVLFAGLERIRPMDAKWLENQNIRQV